MKNEPIDIEKAVQCMGSESLFRDTARSFLSQNDKLMEDLRAAVEAEDLLAVQDAAHCVKGGLVYLHAAPSAEAAKKLQQAAGADMAAVNAAYPVLLQAVADLKKALSTEKTLR